MEKDISQNEISEYSNIKGVATILVVIAHITRMYTSGGGNSCYL